jgi:predicted component of type VI protein secretion system
MINARIAQIDHLLSLQISQILHHPSFQKLEGSRGHRVSAFVPEEISKPDFELLVVKN